MKYLSVNSFSETIKKIQPESKTFNVNFMTREFKKDKFGKYASYPLTIIIFREFREV